MKEVGKVTQIDGSEITVTVTRREECSKCGLCGMKDQMQGVDFKCKSELSINVGDLVSLELQDSGKLIASILVFLVPLILLALTITVCYLLSFAEIWILVTCLLILVLWYTILAFIDKKIKGIGKFTPKIVEIIVNGEKENE